MRRLVRWYPAWVLLGAIGWGFLPEGPVAVGVGAAAVAAVGVVLAIRVPAAAAGLAVAGAAYVGGYAVLAAAPAVLLLGYRATAPFRARPAPGRWRRLASAALLAALVTVPFARLGYERHSDGEGAASPRLTPRPEGAAAPGDGSRLGDGLAALLRRLVDPESNRRWWLLALVAAVLLALLVAVVWLVLRRRRRGREPDAVTAVERLEAVGRRMGRRRRPDEGMLGYASALAQRTGDGRLAVAGPEVSALVYRSRTASDVRVEQALEALETSPPPRPPRRRSLPEMAHGVRSRLGFPVAAAGVAAALVIIGAVGVAVPRLSDLGAAEAGPWTLWTEPPSAVEQWWSCEASDLGVAARAGVDHLTLERSATHTRHTMGSTGYEVDQGTWDGESYMAYDGQDEFPVEGDLVRPWRPFADLDRVLGAFGITDPVVTSHRDATGAPYTRYESMPLAEPDEGIVGIEHLGARWETSVVWVLDVWLDGGGRPVRLRQMTNGDPGRWEWLRLDQPTGDNTPPTCGVDSVPAGSAPQGPWLGAEPWTPTLEVPLQVADDADGHPYDPLPGSADGTWSTMKELRSPGGAVTITALEFPYYDPSDRSVVIAGVTVEPGTRVRVDHYSAEVADGHRLVLAGPDGDGGPVATWRLVAEVDLIEQTPVLAVIPLEVSTDRVDVAYGELDIDDYVGSQLDLDDDGVDDTMVLAEYGGLTRVYAGEDGAGRVVALAALSDGLPWRVLGLPGEAPADVLERERELADCAAGLRTIGPDGVCQR